MGILCIIISISLTMRVLRNAQWYIYFDIFHRQSQHHTQSQL